jgi:hypothetical protein
MMRRVEGHDLVGRSLRWFGRGFVIGAASFALFGALLGSRAVGEVSARHIFGGALVQLAIFIGGFPLWVPGALTVICMSVLLDKIRHRPAGRVNRIVTATLVSAGLAACSIPLSLPYEPVALFSYIWLVAVGPLVVELCQVLLQSRGNNTS